MQEIYSVQENYEDLSKLELSDFDDVSSELPVGLVIGIDYYFCFFTIKVIKKSCGPYASETMLGFVHSRPLSSEHFFSSSLTIHWMRWTDEWTLGEKDDLKQKLSRFWEIETVNPFDECVINQFQRERERYFTRLPFNENHDLLADNFKTWEARLRHLKRKLVDQSILKEYNEIFKDYESKKNIETVPRSEIYKTTGEVHYLP